MLHCRACLLLEKDLRDLKKKLPQGITAYTVEAKPLICYATISGLTELGITEGLFHVGLKFSEHYDEDFPEVFFNTIPFHPNIHPSTGKLFVDFSKFYPQQEDVSLKNILLFVQNLLTNPIRDDIINKDAYDLFMNDPQQYQQIVRHCEQTSRKVFDSLTDKVFKLERPRTESVSKCPPRQITERCEEASAKKISFDYYYNFWKDVATSQPLPIYEVKQTLQMPRRNKAPEKRKSSSTRVSLKPKEDRISLMKKLYLGQLNGDTEEETKQEPSVTPRDVITPTDETEEDLIKWTEALDETQLTA